MSKAYISPQFLDAIKSEKEVKVFQLMYTDYTGRLDAITNEVFEQYLISSPSSNADTFIFEDTIAVRIRHNDIRNYNTIFSMYSVGEDFSVDKQLACAVKIKDNEYGGYELENYTENIIYIDLKQYPIHCTFIRQRDTQYTPIHDHVLSKIDAEDSNKLLDVYDLKKRVVNQFITTTEITANHLFNSDTTHTQFMQNGGVKTGSVFDVNPDGLRVIDPGNNEALNKYNHVATNDII
jgi:hypothetical protein